jgi:PhnB protein
VRAALGGYRRAFTLTIAQARGHFAMMDRPEGENSMQSLTTYLTFDGNCREAMTFYAKCLGVELTMTTFSEAPGNTPPDAGDRIMHSRLLKGDTPILMASDLRPDQPGVQAGFNFSIAVECESVAEIDAMFAALSDGGKVEMPLDECSGVRVSGCSWTSSASSGC